MQLHARRNVIFSFCLFALLNAALGFQFSAQFLPGRNFGAKSRYDEFTGFEPLYKSARTQHTMDLFLSLNTPVSHGQVPGVRALQGLGYHRRKYSSLQTVLNSQTLDPTQAAGNEAAEDEEEEAEIEQIPLIPAERYSSAEWLKCLLTLPFSLSLRRVFSHLVANTLFAAIVWMAYIMWPNPTQNIIRGLTPTPHLLLGSALGLLLVFRTNTAYDRFWEARKLWGTLISRMRELSRIAHASMRGPERERFLKLLAAAPPILLQHLRSGWIGWELTKSQSDCHDLLNTLVPAEDAAMLMKAVNRPFLLVKMLGAVLRKVHTDVTLVLEQRGRSADAAATLSPMEVAMIQSSVMVERQHAEQMLMNLVETIGGCERIVKTTVPISYSRHTSRFLSVWCLTLPLVLVESLKWRVIPACLIVCWCLTLPLVLVESLKWRVIPTCLIVCWALFIIEEVGHLIEDPFNMIWQGMDELKLEKSFPNLRLEVAERLPYSDRTLRTQTLGRGSA